MSAIAEEDARRAALRPKVYRRDWSDFGMADRIQDWYGDRLLRANGSWYIWNGVLWNRVEDKSLMHGVWEDLIRKVLEYEAPLYSEEKGEKEKLTQREKFVDWIKGQSKYPIGRTIFEGAAGRPAFHVTMDDFNRDRHLLNCTNGVVDLKTGRLKPHDPKYRMTMCTGVAYNPSATASRFGKFLRDVQGEPMLRSYLQRLFGYSLTGETREQKFHVHKGNGGNGKGVAMTCVAGVMGTYAQTLAKSVILDSRSKNSGGPSSDLARIAGARMVTFSELNVGERFDEAKVKELSGEDRQVAAYKFRDEFEFQPQAKLHGRTNHMPKFSGGGHSLERRLRVVAWDVEVRNPVQGLADQILAEEAEGILNWAIKGAQAWYAEGLNCPPMVLEESRKTLDGGDAFRTWAEECCDESKSPVDIKELYGSYIEFCEAGGVKPVPMHKYFPDALKERGLLQETGKKDGTTRRKLYSGLVIRGTEQAENVTRIRTATARRRRRTA